MQALHVTDETAQCHGRGLNSKDRQCTQVLVGCETWEIF